MMKTGKSIILILCFCVLGLTGCGEKVQLPSKDVKDVKDEVVPTTTTTTSVTVNKDGSISSSIVEDFIESYYNEDSLKSMIETAIDEYKAENAQAKVKLKSCKVKNGVASVLMEFGDYQAYAGFNEEIFFAGTVKDANMADFDLDVTLNAISDKSENATISKPDLLEMGDSHIVIVGNAGEQKAEQEDDQIRVDCFGEILYVGDGVTVVGKKSADVSLSNGYKMIVFK